MKTECKGIFLQRISIIPSPLPIKGNEFFKGGLKSEFYDSYKFWIASLIGKENLKLIIGKIILKQKIS